MKQSTVMIKGKGSYINLIRRYSIDIRSDVVNLPGNPRWAS